jgi:hypothetical protein
MYLYALEIYYTFNDTDTPTKIETASANTEKSNIYYDLQGQRVENPSKGIYILNGKKVLIK